MRAGGAGLVLSNSLHAACSKADGAHAYETLPYPHAACTGQLTDFDHDCFLHWQHSNLTSPKYHKPFTAVLSAWDLRWNVLCDQFCTRLSDLRCDLANAPDEHSLHLSQDSSLHFLRCASDRHASDVAAQHTHVAKLRSCIASNSAIASENSHQSPISQPFDRERILTIGLVITQKS